jgi:hypothetical protein
MGDVARVEPAVRVDARAVLVPEIGVDDPGPAGLQPARCLAVARQHAILVVDYAQLDSEREFGLA